MYPHPNNDGQTFGHPVDKSTSWCKSGIAAGGGGGGGSRVFWKPHDPLFLHFVNRGPLKNCCVDRDWGVFHEM